MMLDAKGIARALGPGKDNHDDEAGLGGWGLGEGRIDACLVGDEGRRIERNHGLTSDGDEDEARFPDHNQEKQQNQ